jgi:predicted PurR-regulated permease PerM
VVLYTVLQTIESYFITPYVEHRTVSLPPALTIFVQLVLTLLVGLIGAVVAAPLIVASMIAVKTIYYPYVLGKPEDDLDLHLGPTDTA